MQRQPRAPDQPLFSGALIGWSVLQGAMAFALVAAIYLVSMQQGMAHAELRALTFFALVLSIVSLIFVNRTFDASLAALRRPNGALALVLILVVAMLGLTLVWPAASELFGFGPLHPDDLAVTVGAGALVLIGLELLKPRWRNRLTA